MKKNLIALLIIALVSVGLFAADPDPATFNITTTIGGVSNLKLGATTTTKPTTIAGFDDDVEEDNSAFEVDDNNYDDTNTVRSIFAYSNNRTGYTISLAAKAMKGTASSKYINYTVDAGGATVTTTSTDNYVDADDPVEKVTSLTGLTFSKIDIDITVDGTAYENAVNDTYTGTIKVTMTSP